MCSKVEPRKLRAYICPKGFGKLAPRKSTSTDDSCCSNLSISIKTRVELVLSRSRQIQRSHKRSTKLKKDNLAAGTGGTCELSDQFFQISFRGSNIIQLPRPGDFALDGDRSAIVQLFQTRDNARKIHLTFADGHFFAEFLRIGRPKAVLGVNPLHERTKKFHSVDGIRLAVENQIGEVEVDTLIVQTYVLNGSYQRDGSFLAGFVTEILTVALAICGHFAHRRHCFPIYIVVGIFRDKSAMC